MSTIPLQTMNELPSCILDDSDLLSGTSMLTYNACVTKPKQTKTNVDVDKNLLDDLIMYFDSQPDLKCEALMGQENQKKETEYSKNQEKWTYTICTPKLQFSINPLPNLQQNHQSSNEDTITPLQESYSNHRNSEVANVPTFTIIGLGETNTHCRKCKKEFNFATNARRHEKNRPKNCKMKAQINFSTMKYKRINGYECNICAKQMRTISQAKRHENHHKLCTKCGIKKSTECKFSVNKCPYAECEYSTSRNFNLNRHLQNKHK